MTGVLPFNKPYLTGNELKHISDLLRERSKFSGNGFYTQACHNYLKNKFGFPNALLTTSCTDALEMVAILANIRPGDEVIMPSFTFVSTANAFVLRGATIVFADSLPDHPNLDPSNLEELITPRTKAIVVVHYAGVPCDMDRILAICKRHRILCIEDAAQAIGSSYRNKSAGSLGDFSCFSFHETKNVSCGEGGLLVANRTEFFARAEVIWEKGTNRSAFFRGEVDKYNWVDIGSSFLPSELNAAFLLGQLDMFDEIFEKRLEVWHRYYSTFANTSGRYFGIPIIPDNIEHNGHIFYLLASSLEERTALIDYLRSRGIYAVFHYLPLHLSPFYRDLHDGRELPNAEKFSNQLVRLPIWADLRTSEVDYICEQTMEFYN